MYSNSVYQFWKEDQRFSLQYRQLKKVIISDELPLSLCRWWFGGTLVIRPLFLLVRH